MKGEVVSPLLSERALLVLTFAGLVVVGVVGLCRADGMSWPKAILVGLPIGGAAMVGVFQLME